MTKNKSRKGTPEALPPWQQGVLASWDIKSMLHYPKGGMRFLHVRMCKDGYTIVDEGPDNKDLWNRLWHKATKIELEKLKAQTT